MALKNNLSHPEIAERVSDKTSLSFAFMTGLPLPNGKYLLKIMGNSCELEVTNEGMEIRPYQNNS